MRDFKLDARLLRLEHQQIAAASDRRRRRERFRRDLEIAAFHLRHVENAVDHRQQMTAGIVDQLGVFALARRIELERVVAQHVGEADDGVERRAQLVAHGGEEAAFGIVDAFRLLAGDLERALLHLALGHVAQHRDHFALGANSRHRWRDRAAGSAFRSRRNGRRAAPRRCRGGCGIRPSGPRRARPHRRARSDRPAGRPHARGRTGRGRQARRRARRTAARPPARRTARRRCGRAG